MALKFEGKSEFVNNLKEFGDKYWDNVVDGFEGIMEEGVSNAQYRAPWKDRTGNARASIEKVVVADREQVIGILGIGVRYGKYLEVAWGGKYKIIGPTLYAISQYLFKNMKGKGFNFKSVRAKVWDI